ncbi:MAG TPA: hypothetical protein VIL86_08485, partial [Tepidisphaeraceae bacterium]
VSVHRLTFNLARWTYDTIVTDTSAADLSQFTITHGGSPVHATDIATGAGTTSLYVDYDNLISAADTWTVSADQGLVFAGGAALAIPESGAVV